MSSTINDLINNLNPVTRALLGDALIGNDIGWKVKIFYGRTGDGGNYCSLREQGSGSSVAYTPPLGRKCILLVTRVLVKSPGFSAFGIATATSDVGFLSSSAPSSPDQETIWESGVSSGIKTYTIPVVLPELRSFYAYSGSNGGGSKEHIRSLGVELDANATAF